jgi:hypothetical protein
MSFNHPLGMNSSISPASLPLHLQYYINSPNAVMMIDSTGRRVGEDPATAIVYNEIPNASYYEEGTERVIALSQPPASKYTVEVLGGQSGTYALDADVFDGHNSLPSPTSL